MRTAAAAAADAAPCLFLIAVTEFFAFRVQTSQLRTTAVAVTVRILAESSQPKQANPVRARGERASQA